MLAGLATIRASVTRGAISIQFDDGLQTQYTNAFPLLQARGIKATFYVNTATINTASFMTTTQLLTLQNNGHEIDSHGNHHSEIPSLPEAQIRQELQISQQTLRSWGLTANNFAYPDAARTVYTDSIVHDYYRTARWGYVGPFTIQLPISLFLLPAQQGDFGNSNDLPTIKALVDSAYNSNSWVIIVFHSVLPLGGTSKNTISSSDFTNFLDYIQTKGVATITIDQALNIATQSTPTPTPSPTPTPISNPIATPPPTVIPTDIPTSTLEPTPTPILTPSPSPTPSLTPTEASTEVPSQILFSIMPTPTQTTTAAPTDSAILTPTATARPTASPIPDMSATPTPSAITVPATTDNGATVDLIISENVTSFQMSNVAIASNQSTSTTTLSFTITGQGGATGFGNVTIPKKAVTTGTTPRIYIDNQPAQNQGYTQDSNNYYVWYTTHFSKHEVSIVFTLTPNSPQSTLQSKSLPQELTFGVISGVTLGVSIVSVILIVRKKQERKN